MKPVQPETEKLKIGMSVSLLGQIVRYDGGHQLEFFIRDILGQHIEFVPVCPEVECGGKKNAPRLATRLSGIDYKEKLFSWCGNKIR